MLSRGENTVPGQGELPPIVEPPSAELSWVSDARVAGFETFAGDPAVDARLDVLAAAHVSVVVIDSDLSFYMNDARFEESAAYIDAVAKKCHQRGMKAVAYCSLLEALTENAATVPNTMWKDHPDWVQRGIDGKANKFVGGAGRAFWVPAGTESAWLCPTSGYRDYFINRVKRLAQTTLDGLWGDVPLLSDIVGVWPCTNPTCAAKFLAETGLAQPTRVDWNNPVFRRWVAWRHGVIHEFEQAVLAGARTVRPDFQLIVETDTMDHSGGTVQGLDGASRDDGDVLRVWEVSTRQRRDRHARGARRRLDLDGDHDAPRPRLRGQEPELGDFLRQGDRRRRAGHGHRHRRWRAALREPDPAPEQHGGRRLARQDVWLAQGEQRHLGRRERQRGGGGLLQHQPRFCRQERRRRALYQHQPG